jgi:AraC family transcriptional activator of tynA and feaB
MRLQDLQAEYGFDSRDFHVRAPLGDWADRLRCVCGGFTPFARHDVDMVTGGVIASSSAGLRLVQVATDVDFVHRDSRSIRLDYSDHLFLLLQLEGACGIDQFDRQSIIAPGDCILVDSAYPVKLHFEGRYSNHVSVHLPRPALLGDRAQPVRLGETLSAEDPLSVMLGAIIAKISRVKFDLPRGPQLRHLLVHAVKEAFAVDAAESLAAPKERAVGRLELARLLIDRHLTEERLTPQWLAQRLGISLRTLQEDFNSLGATVTTFIRDRRLQWARERLSEPRPGNARRSISDIAYSSGFNDISYFNRCFRKAFDCSPKDIARP